MATKVVLTVQGVREVLLAGELNESPAALGLAEMLPLELSLSRWGEEYYGSLSQNPGSFAGEQIEVMEVGDLAYWEPGNAFCVFFGPTPASVDNEPHAASPVHKIGTVTGDFQALSALGHSISATLSVA